MCCHVDMTCDHLCVHILYSAPKPILSVVFGRLGGCFMP